MKCRVSAHSIHIIVDTYTYMQYTLLYNVDIYVPIQEFTDVQNPVLQDRIPRIYQVKMRNNRISDLGEADNTFLFSAERD